MFDKMFFPFDTEKMTEFFKNADFTKFMADMKMPSVNPDALMAAQRKNMDALIEANKAAAAGYQDLFKKQVAIFEETMAAAQSQMKTLDMSKMTPDTASAQAELARVAFEKAIGNMKMLADTAQKANAEAFEIVSARVRESVEELKMIGANTRA